MRTQYVLIRLVDIRVNVRLDTLVMVDMDVWVSAD